MYIVVGFFNKTNPNSNHLNLFNNHVIKEHGPLLYSSRYKESSDKKRDKISNRNTYMSSIISSDPMRLR
jgi:hypothetical protein